MNRSRISAKHVGIVVAVSGAVLGLGGASNAQQPVFRDTGAGAGHTGLPPTIIPAPPINRVPPTIVPPIGPVFPGPNFPNVPIPPSSGPVIINGGCGWWSPWYNSTRVIIGTTQTNEPVVSSASAASRAAPAEPERELTPKERVRLLLGAGVWDAAITELSNILSVDSSDARATRLLGLAMIARGDQRAGAAMMALAYERYPGLANEALSNDVIRGFGDVRARFQRFAERERSASAFLVSLALVQAETRNPESRDRVMRRMLDQAERLGLEARIGDEFRRAMTPPMSRVVNAGARATPGAVPGAAPAAVPAAAPQVAPGLAPAVAPTAAPASVPAKAPTGMTGAAPAATQTTPPAAGPQ